MKNLLTKEYGPFTGGVWLVIIVGGVGLGLVMRRFMNRDSGEFSAASPAVSGAATDTASPAFLGGGTTLNQGEIVADVIEALKLQTPPPATTDPTKLDGGSATVASLEQQIARLTGEITKKLAQHKSLYDAWKAMPDKTTPKAKEIYKEMDTLTNERRSLEAKRAGLQAELALVKARLAVTP